MAVWWEEKPLSFLVTNVKRLVASRLTWAADRWWAFEERGVGQL